MSWITIFERRQALLKKDLIEKKQYEAEYGHDPENGKFPGLDEEEMYELGQLDEDLKEEYSNMAKSPENIKNLQEDRKEASENLEKAKEDYWKKAKTASNRFLNIFRSKERKKELWDEANKAEIAIGDAAKEAQAAESNIISPKTIRQRDMQKDKSEQANHNAAAELEEMERIMQENMERETYKPD